MISIAEQTIDLYLKNFRTPTTDDLDIKDKTLLEKQWSLFVTIYQKWEVRGASGNIKEIKNNVAEEVIENTIWAISNDSRFKTITSRKILKENEIKLIDPTQAWVLAIKKDYNSIALVLPNINPLLLTWEDLIPVLEKKFNVKKFIEKEYIIYKIETEVIDNFVSN